MRRRYKRDWRLEAKELLMSGWKQELPNLKIPEQTSPRSTWFVQVMATNPGIEEVVTKVEDKINRDITPYLLFTYLGEFLFQNKLMDLNK